MGAARTACALKWRGRQRRGTARQQGSEAARARQRRSAAASARALKCLRARAEQRGKVSGGERERGERKRVERERNCQRLDLIQIQNFQLKLENF